MAYALDVFVLLSNFILSDISKRIDVILMAIISAFLILITPPFLVDEIRPTLRTSLLPA